MKTAITRTTAGIARGAAAGAAAGAAGTTALNAATYVDMIIRGRPSSEAPAQTVERAAAPRRRR